MLIYSRLLRLSLSSPNLSFLLPSLLKMCFPLKITAIILQIISVAASIIFICSSKEFIIEKVKEYPSSRPYCVCCFLFVLFFLPIAIFFKLAISHGDKEKLVKCRRDLQIGYSALAFFGVIPQIVVQICSSNPVIVIAFAISCNLTAIILYPCFILEHISYYDFDDSSEEILEFRLEIFLFHLAVAGVLSLLHWLIGSGEHVVLVLAVSFFYAIFFSPCTMELGAIIKFGVRDTIVNEDPYREDTDQYDYRAHIQARRKVQMENEENNATKTGVIEEETEFTPADTEKRETVPFDYCAHIQARRKARRENEGKTKNATGTEKIEKKTAFTSDDAERGKRYIPHSLAGAAEERAQRENKENKPTEKRGKEYEPKLPSEDADIGTEHISHGSARAAEELPEMDTETTPLVGVVLEEPHVSMENIENGPSSSSPVPHFPSTSFSHQDKIQEQEAQEAEEADELIPNATCLECNVCMLRYNNHVTPRFLVGCGHTICQGCVSNLLIRETVLCPFCRKSSTVPGGMASNLPKNFAILGMIQELGGGGGGQRSG